MSSTLLLLVLLPVLVVCPAISRASQPPAPPQPPEPPVEEPLPDDQADEEADPDEQEEPEDTEPTPRRPFRGRFGGAQPYSSREGLDLTLSAVGGWDEPIAREDVSGLDNERVTVEGPFAGAAATVSYRRPPQEWQIEAFGSSFVGYFPENDGDNWYPSSSATLLLGRTFRFSPRSKLDVSLIEGFATDQRLFGASGAGPSDIPVAGGTTGFDTSLQRAPSLSTSPSVSFVREFGRRSTLDLFYRYRHQYYFGDQDDPLVYPNRQDQQAGIRFLRRVTRDLGLRAGYAYRRSEEPGMGNSADFHDIDIGVDYGRALSFSRKTVFSFRVGSTLGATESGGGTDDPPFSDTRFFVIGGATLTHEMGRTWRTYVDYTRDVGYQDGFTQPLLRDTARVGVGGLIGVRTDVSSELMYSSGSFGFDERNFGTVMTSTQVRTALTRNLAAYAYYYYYWQEFGASVVLPTGIVSDESRHGIRFGLTSWFPLWH